MTRENDRQASENVQIQKIASSLKRFKKINVFVDKRGEDECNVMSIMMISQKKNHAHKTV